MIKEAYCSFEVAKLLKEKGFDEVCHAMYNRNKYLIPTNFPRVTKSEKREFVLDVPTHQMALAWLREVHHIFIEISTSIDLNGKYHFSYTILDKECKYVKLGCTNFNWKYEDAIEAALEYVLTNLI
jgi:hypothetical protein